jgi:hypothetical protein
MTILGLNTLDLLLLVLLFVGILIGFVRGAFSQVISLVSIWLGLVTALWLYRPFSERILQPDTSGFGMSKIAADTLAFVILLLVFFNLYRLGVKYLTKPPEERKRKKKKSKVGPIEEIAPSPMQRYVYGPFNALGGIIMGFIMTTLWLALILGLLQFIFQPTGAEVPYSGFTRGLVINLRTSALLPYFNLVLNALISSVDLFVPRNADILKAFLNFIATPQ